MVCRCILLSLIDKLVVSRDNREMEGMCLVKAGLGNSEGEGEGESESEIETRRLNFVGVGEIGWNGCEWSGEEIMMKGSVNM